MLPHGDSIRSHGVKGTVPQGFPPPQLQMPTASSMSPCYSQLQLGYTSEGPKTSSLLGFHYLLEWLTEFREILTVTCVTSPGGSDSKESACNAGDLGSNPRFKDPLEKGMATHSSIFAWRIPMDRAWWAAVHGLTRVEHDWVTKHTHTGQLNLMAYLGLTESSSLWDAMVSGHLLSSGLTLSFHHDSIAC